MLCHERLKEIEEKTGQIGKLLISLALAYAELDRLNSFKFINA